MCFYQFAVVDNLEGCNMISIIIPIFNAERDLRRMLNSICKQTYQDFECVLIDDGSVDSSYDICKEYANRDDRFRCFTQENRGVSIARNRGMELSKGDYIAFLDADDSIPSNYFEVLHKCCQKGDIAICDVVVVKDGNECSRFTLKDGKINQTQALNELLIRKKLNSGPCAKLFRREIVLGITFPSLKTYEDILFVLDAFSNANRIVTTDQTEYRYIQNSAGAMSAMLKSPSTDIIVATEKLLQFISQRRDLRPECCYITVSHLYQYVIQQFACSGYCNIEFIKRTRALYKRNMRLILSCKVIPWKEKVVFFLFTHGIVMQNGKKFKRIKGG